MISRRAFLRTGALGLGASAFLSGLQRAGLGAASASASVDPGYKALVVVFLFGGNDSNNMLIPNDASGKLAYAKYAAIRNASTCDFSVPQPGSVPATGTLPAGLPVAPKNTSGSTFLLHPSMPNMASLFNRTVSPLGLLANVGPLVEPTRKNAAKATAADPSFLNPVTGQPARLPAQLLSHLDQQQAWHTSIANPGTDSPTGWGGRIADHYTSPNFPIILSDAGDNLFTQGEITSPVVVSPTGAFGLQDHGGNATWVKALAAQSTGSTLGFARQKVLNQALNYADKLSTAVAANTVSWGTLFDGAGKLGSQLKKIADVIAASGPNGLGLQRQVFFCGIGGFDTHADQGAGQSALLAEVDASLFAFYQAMQMIGAGSRVVTSTHSDFARTMEPGAFTGTDHAWGGHHLILGDAVKGGRLFGRYPDITPGGPDDMAGNVMTPGGEGRWVPTTSVDQYAATLTSWFDPLLVPTALFPNLANFTPQKLTFL